MLKRFFYNNIHVFLGIIIGLYLSTFLANNMEICENPVIEDGSTQRSTNINKKPPQTPLKMSQIITKKNQTQQTTINNNNNNNKKEKLIRPRYYSTELGIREQLFVGVLTTEEKINNQTIHINKTIGHLVDKIKFFFTAQYKMKTKYNLTNLVGFTDTRSKYRPYQILKYLIDNYLNNYNYYLIIHDYTYVNMNLFKQFLNQLNVGWHLYLGEPIKDTSYCNLNAGILISNSVLKAIHEHLDWCIINAINDDYNENIGRCIYHSIGLQCQQSVNGQPYTTFKLNYFNLKQHLYDLSRLAAFNKALTIHPILGGDNFYLLNAYFLRNHLHYIKQEIDKLSVDLVEIWPAGQHPQVKPATRFDLPRRLYFNLTHTYLPDDFTIVRRLTDAELKDVRIVLDHVLQYFYNAADDDDDDDNNRKHYQYRRFINGYRQFDLSRGLDYTIDLGFRDLTTGKEIIKRFDICKPLSKIELLTIPYVTENSRITIILPVADDRIDLAIDWLNDYSTTIMQRKEKTLLMLIFLYRKNDDDDFVKIKQFVDKLTLKFRNDDLKILWLSIKLPNPLITIENTPVLNFAIIDLVVKKLGMDNLILMLDLYTNITIDFLNRVRMNTIPNFQIFSPIPFRQYNPKISQFSYLEVNKNAGHFDRDDYKFLSFYTNDYINARKKFGQFLPIVRTDYDIINLINATNYVNYGNIFDMFIKYGDDLHCMRATEMNLKIKFYNNSGGDINKMDEQCNWFLGNEQQLAKYLLNKKDQIPEIN